jgi:chromosome segregation ATPase
VLLLRCAIVVAVRSAQLNERIDTSDRSFASVRAEVSAAEEEVRRVRDRVSSLSARVTLLSGEFETASKAHDTHARCKADSAQQLTLSLDFMKGLEDDVRRRTKAVDEATAAIANEQSTKSSAEAVRLLLLLLLLF